jgi:hypothetical protein
VLLHTKLTEINADRKVIGPFTISNSPLRQAKPSDNSLSEKSEGVIKIYPHKKCRVSA